LYLPIDKLMQQRQDSVAPAEGDAGSAGKGTSAPPEGSTREISRTRGAR